MIYAGTIIDIKKSKTYLLTMDYDIVAIKTKKDSFVGQAVTYSKKDKYADFSHLTMSTIKVFAVAAAVLLLVSAIAFSDVLNLFVPSNQFDKVCTALVSVDINPSIEILVNKEEQIVEAYAINDDGTTVLDTLDLKEKSLTDGVNDIVSAAKAMGYIEDNTDVVLVSATMYSSTGDSGSPEYSTQLQEILGALQGSDVETTILTVYIEDTAIIDEAKINNLSIGKEILFQYAQSQNYTLTTDDIRDKSISELLDLLDALKQDGNLVENITSSDISQDTNDNLSVSASEIMEEPVVEPVEMEDSISPNLTVTTSGESLNFNWTPLNDGTITYQGVTYEGFQFYKIVASATNSSPSYPDDGYLKFFSDVSSSQCTLNPADGKYNLSPTLTSGSTYYFSITYVFENGTFSSNTVTQTVPTYAVAIPVAPVAPVAPVVSSTSVSTLNLSISTSGSTLNFSWTPLGASSLNYGGVEYSDFNFYKVVASETNPNPVYPADGYLTYLTDSNSSGWSLTPSTDSYHQSPQLISGKTYYFSITYVFGNGKLSSNTVQYLVP